MSITLTVGDGYYITHKRCDVRMSRRTKTYREAEEVLRMMKEDLIVDLPRVRYYFHPNEILVLRKPKITDPKYKCPFIA
jgi:hypothetical protein